MTQGGLDRPKPVRFWIILTGCLLALVGFILLIFWGVRGVRTGLSLRTHLTQLQEMASEPSTADLKVACELAQGLRTDIVALERDAGSLVRLAPLFSSLPRVGGDLRAAPHLLAVADGLSEVGDITCQTLEPLLTTLGGQAGQDSKLSLQDALSVVTQNQVAWHTAISATTRTEEAWHRVDAAALSPNIARKLAPLDRGLPLLRQGFSALTVAPQLLGMDRPRTYLMLALNEDELRPGGGFITGVGEIRVEAGKVITMTFRDSYAVDDFTQPYSDPPDPLRRHMGLDLLVLRDSNWSPDFPTAARQAAALYRPGYPVEVDGVIAIDQRAVQALVGALAPLSVGADGQAITGETILPFIRQAWAPDDGKLTTEWYQQRKSFMGPLAAAAWKRIEQGRVEWSKLGRVVLSLVEGKHLLAHFSDPKAEAILTAQGWDGALKPGPGDSLAIIDANVGYNKTNARIRQAASYQVDLRTAQPQASLVLTYTHTTSGNYPCLPEVKWDPVYDQMMDRCYWDYLRVYVPEGSRLQAATRIPVPADATWDKLGDSGEVIERPASEGPWRSLEVLSLLPPATTQTHGYTFTLPSHVVQRQGNDSQYVLRLIKQPGAGPYPVVLRVHPPDRSTIIDVSPESGRMDSDGWLEYHLSLDRDQVIQLRWRREE